MRAYRVLLHIFAALLLLDYGMFSTPAPSAPEMSTTVISDTSDSKTIVTTAESTIVENDSSESGSGSGDDRLNNSITVSPNTTQSLKHGQANESIVDYPIITKNSKDYSAKENESISEKIASTAQPKQDSTTKAKGAKIGVSDSGSGSLTGGIIILIFIIILIVCLLFILYFLRKKARSYSFDLTRDDIPANDYADTPFRGDQQGVSYEQTNKDLSVCLDYIQEDKSEEKDKPIANGSTGEKTEQTPNDENDYTNFPEENSFSSDSCLGSPMKKVEFNLDLDLLGSDSELNRTTEAETTDAEQNENNNNVGNAGQGTAAEIFTEISLDEPKEQA